MDNNATTIGFSFEDSGPDTVVGPYKLGRQLGEGGMGVVYHARQSQPIRRDVALKLIKPGMDSKQVIARFEAERQALAVMDHPNISHVFDAGTTAEGRPYFVMELVDGIPITQYCDSKRLSVRERIKLLIPVCQAIQHAHQKGIIHRDVKPSNILIAEHEGKPVPKVIDFGLAKALGHQLSDASMMSNVGVAVGTPDYMSPEQADLIRQDVDTRTDVYSLGAVLYELLTGTTPLKRERLENAGYVDVLQRIRTEEPETPSRRLRTAQSSVDVAANRPSDSFRVPKLLRGELDWITMKTLEKDRTRRYETVNGLAWDLQRYLDGDPVVAGPASRTYQVRKFMQKHRAWLVTTAAVALILVVGILVSTSFAIRASRAEKAALLEAATSTAVSDFLRKDLLAQASANTQAAPNAKPDPDLKVRTALDRAAARIQGKFSNQPLVEAAIRQTIGSAYKDLGLYVDAQRQLELALNLRRNKLGENHPDTLSTGVDLASLYRLQGQYAQGETLLRSVLELYRKIHGERHPDTLATMVALGLLYQNEGKFAEAEQLSKKTLEISSEILGSEHPTTLDSMNDLAGLYMSQAKYNDAESLFAKALQIRRRVSGEDHPETLTVINNLAVTTQRERKYQQAESLFKENLVSLRRVLGNEHLFTLQTMNNLATTYRAEGKYVEALALLNSAFETLRRVVGEEHPNTLRTLHNLAMVYRDQRNYPHAERSFLAALDGRRRLLGDDHPDTLTTLQGLAVLYEIERKYTEAETALTKVINIRRRVLSAQHPDTLDSLLALGRLRLHQRNYVSALEPLQEAMTAYEKVMPDAWERYNAQSLLGATLTGQEQYAAAEPLSLAGYRGLVERQETIPVSERYAAEEARQRIFDLYERWGKVDKADEWRQKLQVAKQPNTN